MKYFTFFFVVLALVIPCTATGKVMDTGAVMPNTGQAQSKLSLAYTNPQPFEFNVVLPSLLDRERREIENTSLSGRQKIGIHREVPYTRTGDLSNKLSWKKDGESLVAYLRVHSPEAISIRISANFELPANATVTFYELDSIGKINAMYNFTTTQKGLKAREYWSPIATGESIGIEIRLLQPSQKQDVNIELLTIAHQFAIPFTAGSTFDAMECANHEDIQCAIDDGDISESLASATMKLWFQSEGSTYTCTGTLMNVSNDEGLIPYILTAAHCISTQAEARSILAEWNFQGRSCTDQAISENVEFTFGGADLLATRESYDQTLIRLRDDPPAGVSFSGWWTANVGRNIKGIGAHHPAGDLKKFFSGTTQGNNNVETCNDDGEDCFLLLDAINLHMTNGASEGGSSGAGLQIVYPNDDNLRLVGVLSGSENQCTNGLVSFGEFRHFYPFIEDWFNPVEDNDDDHGNTKATATLIDLISTTTGEIEENDDVDYFEIEVTRAGTIKVYTTGSLDTVGQFTSSDGEIDIVDDDDGDGLNFSISAEVAPGTYHIKVESWENTLTGSYTLHVEYVDPTDDHGNTLLTATTISSSARAWEFSTIGYIEIETDKDVFELEIEHDSTLTIYTEGDTDTSAVLTNLSGVEVLRNEDVDDDDSNFRLTGTIDEGTYFLSIEGDVTKKSKYKLIIDVAQ